MKGFKWVVLGYVFLCFAPSFAFNPPPAHDVFHVKVSIADPNTIHINFNIKPKFFVYKERFKLQSPQKDFFEVIPIQFPKSESKTDSFGHVIPVYRNQFKIPIRIIGLHAGEDFFKLQYQGCSDEGFCYPPETLNIKLAINEEGGIQMASFIEAKSYEKTESTSPAVSPSIPSNTYYAFHHHHWSISLLIFLGLGLLLSFTPCVLPMIPVLSGILVGHGPNLSSQKAALISLSYVMSMAITYAIIGGVIAFLGQNIQVALQSPISIGLFSGLFVVLAISMFGGFDLKLPVRLQTQLSQFSQKYATGHYLGAAIMGALSTLILSPCVTAPLIGALGYIANTGNVVLGIGALFCMGLGMGIPLILIGTSLGRFLPKAGLWMNTIKDLFGLILLGMALYLLDRIVPSKIMIFLWSGLFIFTGLILGALKTVRSKAHMLIRVLGISTLSYGIYILLGAALGSTNPFQPTQWGKVPFNQSKMASWVIVDDIDELNNVMQKAMIQNRPVILDFYADWCTACKVNEVNVLLQNDVINAMEPIQLIKVDLTANDHNTQTLLQHYHVIAPPTYLFFDKNGHARPDFTLVGEISKDEFLSHLKRINL